MDINSELISLSRYYGSNPGYVIAGGGNTSYKEGDRMWIKDSGTSLADIDESGFVCLSRTKLNKVTSTGYSKDPFKREEAGEVPKHCLYRWHVMDPIRFEKNLRVTIQALGWQPDKKFQPLSDDIASVGYWYQSEPHGEFSKLPTIEERWPR